MRVSYTDWWNDIVAIGRANASILVALAGAFVFLPALLAAFVAVPFVQPGQGAEPAEIIAAYSQYFSDNWLPQLALILLSTLAQLLIYIVLLDARRPAVGEAFRIALPLFVPFFLTNILASLILVGGGILLFVPALYLIGRVMLSGAAFVAGGSTNPFAAISRSFALTKGQGWRIFFFVFLLFLVAIVIQLAIHGTLGSALALATGGAERFGLGKLLLAAVEAFFGALFAVLSAVTWVALYRRVAIDPAKTFA